MKKSLLQLLVLGILIMSCETESIIIDSDFIGSWKAIFTVEVYEDNELVFSSSGGGHEFLFNEDGSGNYHTPSGESFSSSWAYVESRNCIHISLRDTVPPTQFFDHEVLEMTENTQLWESNYTFSNGQTGIYRYELTKN